MALVHLKKNVTFWLSQLHLLRSQWLPYRSQLMILRFGLLWKGDRVVPLHLGLSTRGHLFSLLVRTGEGSTSTSEASAWFDVLIDDRDGTLWSWPFNIV